MKIQIKNPCHEDWNTMSGIEKRKFCSSCQKTVHNLSAVTKQEAMAIVAQEENPCVRYQVDTRGRVRFRSALPLLAVFGAACSYVPPMKRTDDGITKISKMVRRGTAQKVHDTFSLVRGPSSSDGLVERGFRATAGLITTISDGILHRPSPAAGMVMGEMVAEPVPLPTWEDTASEDVTFTTPDEEEVAQKEQ